MENITANEPLKEKKQTSMFRNSINYGLYTSAGFILVSMLFYALDIDRTGWINYLTFIILIIGIIIGTKSYKDKFCGGYLSYGRCLGSGVIISAVVGVIMAVFTYLFYQYFDPSELQKIVEIAEQNMADQGLTDEQIEQAMSFSKMFMSPVGMSVSMVFGMAFWGTIFSLIIAIFLKKNDDSFNAM
ncbi:MAG: hypothetical protein FD166_2840 [Bacteroidetes bacterium]|nr:MAG: hypothetical protein FD166_2840 [Bacteroidota bacterium]